MDKKQSAKQIIGTEYEKIAATYLKDQGLTLIKHQYECKVGEIDLIMRDKNELVFVEVRSRTTLAGGDLEETVTWPKQQRIIRAALFYTHSHDWTEAFYLRFDFVAILGNQLNCKINWIQNAFGVE
jgi:putative endonuclease